MWVVVLNWNGLADTLACLESLRRIRYGAQHVVVVDNGSTDGSVEALRQAASSSQFDFVEAGGNLGYAGGNNLGIRHALDKGADFVLLLNNDTTVDPMLVDELVSTAAKHPEAGCLGPWIFYMHDPDRLWFTRSEWDAALAAFTAPGKGRLAAEMKDAPSSTDYVCGAALFFRAAVAREIGLLDERFFLVYEDADWCFRARRAGFRCIMVPEARVWHRVGSSFSTESSPLRTYFSTRNRLLWAERNAPRREWRRLLRNAFRRMLPGLGMDRNAGVPAHKAFSWAIASFMRQWRRKRHDPHEAAHRRAVLDYLFRRLGDCPEAIRRINRAWVDAQAKTKAGAR